MLRTVVLIKREIMATLLSKLNYSDKAYAYVLSNGCEEEAPENTLSNFKNFLPNSQPLPVMSGSWRLALEGLILDSKYSSLVSGKNEGVPHFLVVLDRGYDQREVIKDYHILGQLEIPARQFTFDSFLKYMNQKSHKTGGNVDPYNLRFIGTPVLKQLFLTFEDAAGDEKMDLYIETEMCITLGIIPEGETYEACLSADEIREIRKRNYEYTVGGNFFSPQYSDFDISLGLREAFRRGKMKKYAYRGKTYYRFTPKLVSRTKLFFIQMFDFVARDVLKDFIKVTVPDVVNVQVTEIAPQPASFGHHQIVSCQPLKSIKPHILVYEPVRSHYYALANCAGSSGLANFRGGASATNQINVRLLDQDHNQLKLRSGTATIVKFSLQCIQEDMSSTTIRVVSADQVDRHPENTVSDFSCDLVDTLIMNPTQRYSLGVSSIVFPSQFEQIPYMPGTPDDGFDIYVQSQYFDSNTVKGYVKFKKFTHYNEVEFVEYFLNCINTILDEERTKIAIKIGTSHRLLARGRGQGGKRIPAQEPGTPPVNLKISEVGDYFDGDVTMPEQLAGSLGLKNPLECRIGRMWKCRIGKGTKFSVDLNLWKPHSLLVFSPNVLPSIMADTHVPILATVPVVSETDTRPYSNMPYKIPRYTSHNPKRIDFIPLAGSIISTLTFSVRTVSGHAPYFRLKRDAKIYLELVIQKESHRHIY